MNTATLRNATLALTLAGALGLAQANPVYSGTIPANLGGTGAAAGAGNQAYGQMLGLNFSILDGRFRLTHLGVFDDLRNGLSTSISVALYELVNNTRVLVAGTVFGAGTSNADGEQFIFRELTGADIVLDQGQYTIRAVGFNAQNRNFNTNFLAGNLGNTSLDNSTFPIAFDTFGGLLQNGASVFGGSINAAGTVHPHSSAFGAASLRLAEIPEPGGWALIGGGLLALGTLRRRRPQT